MHFLIDVLTLVMVLDCLVLIFLVLLQLPKKEAGAGLAFGGAATDALFGAGSGNVLTKITKYAAVIFFGLAVVLSLLQSRVYHGSTSNFLQKVEQPGPSPFAAPPSPAPSAAAPAAPAATPAPAASVPLLTNGMLSAPQPAGTNAPAASQPASTNLPEAK